ncbi:MAG: helix-turn-helix transcriptional regulator [Gemmatimonadetes bacterium]|nr:helix-turn-helix transcriptional regulator [Gemmatimonadota bacterium]
MSVHRRLREAIDLRGVSVRAFHREMTGRRVAGSSYPTIHRYLSGRTSPSLEFLREAAQVLGVREAWLAAGEGGPTETEEAMRSAQSRLLGDDWEASFKEARGKLPHMSALQPHVQAAFLDTWGRYERFRRPLLFVGTFPPELLSARLGEAMLDQIMAPFEQWGVHAIVGSHEFNDYVMAALQAINLAMSVPLESEELEISPAARRASKSQILLVAKKSGRTRAKTDESVIRLPARRRR